jgi:pimeloyl-ACP methyl ester carboxylesterase
MDRAETSDVRPLFGRSLKLAPGRASELRNTCISLLPPVRGGLNIVRWTEMPRGGHFAAMEEPELLVEDVRAFFRSLR